MTTELVPPGLRAPRPLPHERPRLRNWVQLLGDHGCRINPRDKLEAEPHAALSTPAVIVTPSGSTRTYLLTATRLPMAWLGGAPPPTHTPRRRPQCAAADRARARGGRLVGYPLGSAALDASLRCSATGSRCAVPEAYAVAIETPQLTWGARGVELRLWGGATTAERFRAPFVAPSSIWQVFSYHCKGETTLGGDPLHIALRSCGVNPTVAEIQVCGR